MACFNCGECCRDQRITVTRQELDLIWEKTGVIIKALSAGENRFLTMEPCPFWKGNCSIYSIRPCQCRLYHCGRLKRSDPRIDSMNQIRQIMLENPDYAKWRQWMEDAAVRWGNQRGWNWQRSIEWRQPIGSEKRLRQLDQLLQPPA